jgi:hypothetical protein
MTRVKSFICEMENFILNSFINFELVKRFKDRKKVMKFWSFGDSTISGNLNKLHTLNLSSRKIQ